MGTFSVPQGFIEDPSAALIHGMFSLIGTIDLLLPRDVMTLLACCNETEDKGYPVDIGIGISFSAETIDDANMPFEAIMFNFSCVNDVGRDSTTRFCMSSAGVPFTVSVFVAGLWALSVKLFSV
eukprot:Seg7461.1 transcript_id=Seg7461.1/GoldUCD/mRNA.D3Y31 product="hypothetical protein" protein_id=Seg7461.1/GoldUCD/D3Y31